MKTVDLMHFVTFLDFFVLIWPLAQKTDQIQKNYFHIRNLCSIQYPVKIRVFLPKKKKKKKKIINFLVLIRFFRTKSSMRHAFLSSKKLEKIQGN